MYKCYPKMLMIKKLKNISSCRYSCATFKAGVDLQEASSQECDLKAAIATKLPEQIELIKKFRKENGNKPVGEVTVDMLYNGMRGIKGLICETSVLDPEEGIRFRGYTVTDCQKNLPKMTVCGEPLPEGIFWLLCTGEIPTEAQVKSLSSEWAARSKLPDDLKKILDSVPSNIHPMSQFSAICTLLNRESKFAQAYGKGILKSQYWEYVYEDSMDLIGKIPSIAASIYLRTYKNTNDLLEHCATKDWSLNFTNMLGFDNDEFTDLMRLYLTIHSDHEGGNVSAHATHLVGSALSDPYLSYAAGMNGLAGPLHGRANQEVLEWCLKMIKEIGEIPTDDQIKDFVMKTLKSGKVIPGYGHAVLRTTDPRFNVLYEFAQTHIQEDNLVNLVSSVFRVVPPVLLELGKVKNPWPNVDAHSGVLLYHYGMTEMSFYTVLFGVSRALGVLASLIWNRALGFPIERPKSLSTNNLIKSLI